MTTSGQDVYKRQLYNHALTGNTDCGGLISYNYISGEPVTGLAEGRPLFVPVSYTHLDVYKRQVL